MNETNMTDPMRTALKRLVNNHVVRSDTHGLSQHMVIEIEKAAWDQARTALAATPEPALDVDYESMRMQQHWPTPDAMRQAADGLDKLAIPRYGDILRWVADRCDDSLDARRAAKEETDD